MQRIPESAVRGWHKVARNCRVPRAISIVCPHCSERGIFALEKLEDDLQRLCVMGNGRCPGCGKAIRLWVLRADASPPGDDGNPEAMYVYPVARNYYQLKEFAADIPEALQRSFVSTVDSFNARNYVATAVGARRTLEGIFQYLLPEPKWNTPLARLIDSAMQKVDLAAPLSSLSNAIREGGNLGAHFDPEKEPNEALARNMVELLDYLISYLYVLPKEIQKLEESLGRTPPV